MMKNQLLQQQPQQRKPSVILIIGLGNPGAKYENNRHNVGFKIIEALAKFSASSSFKKLSSIVEISMLNINDIKMIFAKPQTYMNLSGEAVRALIDFYKIKLEDVYVFHDDIDLDFARIKIKRGGGAGGHNGLKSIDNIVGKDYWRIRLGVDRPPEKSMVSSFVLSNFTSGEEQIIDDKIKLICENFGMLFSDKQKYEQTLND